jgi:hypothetical protein
MLRFATLTQTMEFSPSIVSGRLMVELVSVRPIDLGRLA